MYKVILSLLFLSGICGVANAETETVSTVAARTDCAATQIEIDALGDVEFLSDEQNAQLTKLQNVYRRDCMKSAGRRAARSFAVRTSVVKASDDTSDDVATEDSSSCSEYDDNGCCVGEIYTDMGGGEYLCCPETGDICFMPTADKIKPKPIEEPVVPEKTAEEIEAEIIANLDKGLCADGEKPNKFGCCGAEIFKELPNGEFGCCDEESGECFPAMK